MTDVTVFFIDSHEKPAFRQLQNGRQVIEVAASKFLDLLIRNTLPIGRARFQNQLYGQFDDTGDIFFFGRTNMVAARA